MRLSKRLNETRMSLDDVEKWGSNFEMSPPWATTSSRFCVVWAWADRGTTAPAGRTRARVSAYQGLPPLFGDPLPDRRGADGESVEDWSTESSASITECHPREFFLQSLPLRRVPRFSESSHERKESLLLRFFGLKAGLYQIHEHTV